MPLVHTCIRVLDPDRSVAFYEALGFEPRGRLQFESAYNLYMGLPGDGDTLELTVNVGRTKPYDLGDGYNHVAITVDDLDSLLAKLAEQGIEPEKPPFAPGGREEYRDRVRRRPRRLPGRADRRRRLPDSAGRRPGRLEPQPAHAVLVPPQVVGELVVARCG